MRCKVHSLQALRSQRGAAAVEFALVLPLLTVLLFGIIEFGRAYNAKVTLTHAVREGARALAIGADDPEAVARAASAALDGSQLDITVSVCEPGLSGTVSAVYHFEYTIPLFFTGTQDLTAEGVMRCGG